MAINRSLLQGLITTEPEKDPKRIEALLKGLLQALVEEQLPEYGREAEIR